MFDVIKLNISSTSSSIPSNQILYSFLISLSQSIEPFTDIVIIDKEDLFNETIIEYSSKCKIDNNELVIPPGNHANLIINLRQFFDYTISKILLSVMSMKHQNVSIGVKFVSQESFVEMNDLGYAIVENTKNIDYYIQVQIVNNSDRDYRLNAVGILAKQEVIPESKVMID